MGSSFAGESFYDLNKIAIEKVIETSGDGRVKYRVGQKNIPKKDEKTEVRINATGNISEFLGENIPIPQELKPISHKVAKIAIGQSHALILFAGGELYVTGNNRKG